jgi:hypothetical protein
VNGASWQIFILNFVGTFCPTGRSNESIRSVRSWQMARTRVTGVKDVGKLQGNENSIVCANYLSSVLCTIDQTIVSINSSVRMFASLFNF